LLDETHHPNSLIKGRKKIEFDRTHVLAVLSKFLHFFPLWFACRVGIPFVRLNRADPITKAFGRPLVNQP
jgi:hypothetical protein